MNEQNILKTALTTLERELGITITLLEQHDAGMDECIRLSNPIHQTLPLEIKRWHSKPASMIANAMKQRGEGMVLVTDHVSESKAKALREHGIEYFDTAGNAYLNRPGLYVWVTGKKNPYWEHPEVIDARASFERSGLKVTFCLIRQPELVQSPFRVIAEAANVALGTVKRVVDSLEQSGYLFSSKAGRHLEIKQPLLNDWAQAYVSKLMPKLHLGTFQSGLPITDESLKGFDGVACWGGEQAAAYFTDTLKPKIRTIYVTEKDQPSFMKFFKMRRPSPFNQNTGGSEIEVRTLFWTDQPANDIYAHPLVVYADLLATNNARNTEAARALYEQHLEPLCR